jgi:hypothetical protein
MARALRYVQDKPGQKTPNRESPHLQPFGMFAVSPRIQALTIRIAKDVKAVAKSISPDGEEETGKPKYKDQFIVVPGKPLKIKGLSRATALVGNTDPKAAAIEFGSGDGSVGDSAGEGRPQGGSNQPFRVLGRAGAMIGEFRGE